MKERIRGGQNPTACAALTSEYVSRDGISRKGISLTQEAHALANYGSRLLTHGRATRAKD
jgi:hypothetical protein